MSATAVTTAVYSLDDVRALFGGASSRTVRRWVDAGKFPRPLPLPGPWRFRRSDVETFLQTGKLPEAVVHE